MPIFCAIFFLFFFYELTIQFLWCGLLSAGFCPFWKWCLFLLKMCQAHQTILFCSVPLAKHVISTFFLVFWFLPFLCIIFVYAANAPGTIIKTIIFCWGCWRGSKSEIYFVACEQALLFGRVKRASREWASERWSREGHLARAFSRGLLHLPK